MHIGGVEPQFVPGIRKCKCVPQWNDKEVGRTDVKSHTVNPRWIDEGNFFMLPLEQKGKDQPSTEWLRYNPELRIEIFNMIRGMDNRPSKGQL